MEETSVFEEEQSPLDAFPDQVQKDVDGLAWLGYLEDEFDFCGHHFVIRTLRGDEELLAALVSKEFTETIAEAKASIWATVALALLVVDGDEDFCPPVGRSEKEYARGRFRYVTSRWFWPTAIYIFNRYSALVERQLEAIQALEDLSPRSRITSTPSPDFSTDKASSEEEAPQVQMEDIREYLDPDPDG